MKELYGSILFDNGRAPKAFQKDNLAVAREDINDVINKDIRLSSRNLRGLKAGRIEQAKEREANQPDSKQASPELENQLIALDLKKRLSKVVPDSIMDTGELRI